MVKDYLLATNDKDGKTIVIVPTKKAKTMFDAVAIANRHFKVKKNTLHCCAGFMKGNKIESRSYLTMDVNCWMVWR